MQESVSALGGAFKGSQGVGCFLFLLVLFSGALPPKCYEKVSEKSASALGSACRGAQGAGRFLLLMGDGMLCQLSSVYVASPSLARFAAS